MSGLYGEGRIEAETTQALMLPEGVLVKAGDKSYVWRVKGDTLDKVSLAVGPRDSRTGYYEVRSGLAAGDVIMRTPSSTFKEGQKVKMVAPVKSVASAPAAAQGK